MKLSESTSTHIAGILCMSVLSLIVIKWLSHLVECSRNVCPSFVVGVRDLADMEKKQTCFLSKKLKVKGKGERESKENLYHTIVCLHFLPALLHCSTRTLLFFSLFPSFLNITAAGKIEEKLVGSFEQNSFNELIKFRSAVIASQPFQRGHKNFTCFFFVWYYIHYMLLFFTTT